MSKLMSVIADNANIVLMLIMSSLSENPESRSLVRSRAAAEKCGCGGGDAEGLSQVLLATPPFFSIAVDGFGADGTPGQDKSSYPPRHLPPHNATANGTNHPLGNGNAVNTYTRIL